MPKIRRGKTVKDRRNGAQARNRANKLERVAWQHRGTSSPPTHDNFPYTTCNGKRNKTRWTGKDNKTMTRTFVGQKGW